MKISATSLGIERDIQGASALVSYSLSLFHSLSLLPLALPFGVCTLRCGVVIVIESSPWGPAVKIEAWPRHTAYTNRLRT